MSPCNKLILTNLLIMNEFHYKLNILIHTDTRTSTI